MLKVHLAMLAQVKNDEEILQTEGSHLADRLDRMRNWINGPHFPEELRIRILNEPKEGLDENITTHLRNNLESCDWNPQSIGEVISNTFKENQISPKEGYQTLYQAILGVDKGPRLAPILSELDRNHVLNLLG